MPKPPPLPPPAPVVTFFVAENGQPVGPLTLDQVGAEIAAKRINSKSLVWKSGDPAWIAADQVLGRHAGADVDQHQVARGGA